MIRTILIILSLLRLNLAFSIEQERYEYYFTHDSKTVLIPFYKTNNVLVNDKCTRNLRKCWAYKAITQKYNKKFDAEKYKHLSGPAAGFCKHLNGVPMVLRDKQLNHISVCGFQDQTIISSWDLYNNHSSKLRKK